VEAANPDHAHRPLEKSHNLAASLSHVETRKVRNDYTLQWEGRLYQIERQAITTDYAEPKYAWRGGSTTRWRCVMARSTCR
jgi:hypothetical protein